MNNPEQISIELNDTLSSLEKKRKYILLDLCFLTIFLIAAVKLYLSGNPFSKYTFSSPISMIIIFFSYPLFRFWTSFSSKKKIYVNQYKKNIIGRIVKNINKNLTFYPDNYIPKQDFENSNIFDTYISSYQGDSLVTGYIKNTAIAFSQLHAQYITESRDRDGHTTTHYHTIFKGIFFIADFNKHFSSNTVLIPRSSIGLIKKSLEKLGSILLNKTELIFENQEFNKYFKVYSHNHIETRYILTPSMMERILNIKKKFGGDIYISFNDSKMFIALPFEKDLFTPSVFQSAFKFESFYYILSALIDIVEEADLNTRIWSKY